MRHAVVGMGLLLLVGCATPLPGEPERETDRQRLARECRERGGILQPTPGAVTGRPETENYCLMHSSPPRTQ